MNILRTELADSIKHLIDSNSKLYIEFKEFINRLYSDIIDQKLKISLVAQGNKVSDYLTGLESRLKASEDRAIKTGLKYSIELMRQDSDELVDLIHIEDTVGVICSVYLLRLESGGARVLGIVVSIN